MDIASPIKKNQERVHIVTWQNDFRRGLDWLSDLLDTFKTRDYILQITIIHKLVFPVTVFTVQFGNVFQLWMFLCFRAHVLAGWRSSYTNLLLF
jgi:hypothetical protein